MGDDSQKAGYAEGKITLYAGSDGNYSLYWANKNGKLSGYSSITSKKLSAGESVKFSFGYHTAIPYGATKIIALNNSTKAAEYNLPDHKILNTGKPLYTFNSYSDIHIDTEGYYKQSAKRWTEALKFGVKKNTDFIVTSGDTVTNALGPDSEWELYERLLAESDYVNPVWESDGNHDMRYEVSGGLKSFIKATGTDNTTADFDKKKPYFYIKEKNSGDLFIFMAHETDHKTADYDQFSKAQMSWVENLVEKYYGTGINIYIIQHSPIDGFGAGDRMSNPYYKALLNPNFSSTARFKSLLKKYRGLVFLSGHTHEDFSMGYNYSNENNEACHMLHNPSVAGTTLGKSDGTLEYNDGNGENSQGYYVEVFDKEIIFYGANLSDGQIYPRYSYIMEGARSIGSDEDETQPTSSATEATESSEAVTESTSETAESTSETAGSTSATETTETETTETETITDTVPETTEPEYKTGDVNMDDSINVKDATLVQKAIAKMLSLSEKQEKLADTDFNNSVNIKDATLIQKYAAKIIDSFAVKSSKKSAIRTGDGGFTAEITKAMKVLTSYYPLASYDRYQELKKLYYQYKDKSSVGDESAVIAEFENKISVVTGIAEQIGLPKIYLIGDTYYFENTHNWSEVYAYAWKGSSNNASWPGAKLKKVGTNAGHDVYKIKFDSEAQYNCIIFNGGKDQPQTVNISLEKYKGNCFYLDGTSSDGKHKVGSFTYKSSAEDGFALYYYTANHPWGYEKESFFSKNDDGSYTYEYTSPDSNSLSFIVYNTKTKKFNCVGASTPFTYTLNAESLYNLSESSTQGKSITANGLSAGAVLRLTYKPDNNTLSVLCK